MSLSEQKFDQACDRAIAKWRQSLPPVGDNSGPLTRQQRRRIERQARKYIAARDADLIARLKAEKRGLMWFDATLVYRRQT